MKFALYALAFALIVYALAIFNIVFLLLPESWFDRFAPGASIIGGLILGVGGYYLANFVMAPVIRWNQLRAEVTSTVIFYKNILLAENMDFIEERKKGEAELRRLATEILGVAQIIQMT